MLGRLGRNRTHCILPQYSALVHCTQTLVLLQAEQFCYFSGLLWSAVWMPGAGPSAAQTVAVSRWNSINF